MTCTRRGIYHPEVPSFILKKNCKEFFWVCKFRWNTNVHSLVNTNVCWEGRKFIHCKSNRCQNDGWHTLSLFKCKRNASYLSLVTAIPVGVFKFPGLWPFFPKLHRCFDCSPELSLWRLFIAAQLKAGSEKGRDAERRNFTGGITWPADLCGTSYKVMEQGQKIH